MRKLRRHLTYANVMATLAVFIALGGAAYAANTIGSSDIIDESILSVDLKNGQVRTSDIGDGQIRSPDVRNDTQTDGGLTAADLAPDSVGLGELNPAAFQADDISPTGLFNRYEIAINAIQGNEIQDETLTGADITDGQLEDQDIAEGAFTDFLATVGVVPAHSCVEGNISGINARLDHMVLTPDYSSSERKLVYTVKYLFATGSTAAVLVTCNHTDAAIDDGTTRFNLLVIDAL